MPSECPGSKKVKTYESLVNEFQNSCAVEDKVAIMFQSKLNNQSETNAKFSAVDQRVDQSMVSIFQGGGVGTCVGSREGVLVGLVPFYLLLSTSVFVCLASLLFTEGTIVVLIRGACLLYRSLLQQSWRKRKRQPTSLPLPSTIF